MAYQQQQTHAILPVMSPAQPMVLHAAPAQQQQSVVMQVGWQQRPATVADSHPAVNSSIPGPLSGAEFVALTEAKATQQHQVVHQNVTNGVMQQQPQLMTPAQQPLPVRVMPAHLLQIPHRPPPLQQQQQQPGRRSMIDDCVKRDEKYWDRVTLKIDVAFTDHSHIIGRSGKNTQAIMRDTGCHIHFPDSNKNRDLEKSNQVSIAGMVGAVEESRKRVRSLAPLSIVFSLEKLAPHVDVSQLVEHPCLEQVYSCAPLNVIVRHDRPNPVANCIVRGSVHQEQQLVQAASTIAAQLLTPGVRPVFQLMLEVLPSEQRQVIGYEQRNVNRISSLTGVVIKFPSAPEAHRGATSFLLYATDVRALLAARKHILGLLPVHLTFDVHHSLESVDLVALEKQLGVNLQIKSRHTVDGVAVQAVTVRGIEYKVQALYEARSLVLKDMHNAVTCNEYDFMKDFPLAPPLSQGSILTAYPNTQPSAGSSRPQQHRPMPLQLVKTVAQTPVFLSPAPTTPRMLVPWPAASAGALIPVGVTPNSPVVAIRSPVPFSPVPCTNGGQFNAAGIPLPQPPPQTPTPPPPPSASSQDVSETTGSETSNGTTSSSEVQEAIVKQEVADPAAGGDVLAMAGVCAADTDEHLTPKAATADTASTSSTPANEPNVHIRPPIRLPEQQQPSRATSAVQSIDPNPKNSPLANGMLQIRREQEWRAVGNHDYVQQRARAHRAMQQEPTGVLRRPDQQWCGLGFSVSQQVPQGFNASVPVRMPVAARGGPPMTYHHDDSLMEQMSVEYEQQQQAAMQQQQYNGYDTQPRVPDFGATTIFDEAHQQQHPAATSTSSMHSVEFILRQLGLSHLIPTFREEEIDYDTLMGLHEHEVAELVRKMGDRKKLLGAIHNLRSLSIRGNGWQIS